MRRLLIMICFLLALLTAMTACSAGLRISGIPEEIRIENGKPVQFEFTLDNSNGTDLQNVSLILEEVITDSDTDELLGTLSINSVNEVKHEAGTDFVEIEQIPAGASFTVEASYVLYVNPQNPVCVTVTLYDEDFEVITSEKIRCTVPGTVSDDKLVICGIPVFTIIIVLVSLNVLAWSFIVLRKFRKHHEMDPNKKQQGSRS